jgi:hypothetical protein
VLGQDAVADGEGQEVWLGRPMPTKQTAPSFNSCEAATVIISSVV